MPGLFATLSATAKALEAQSYGLDVTGQNIANVGTAGYARREVILTTTAAPDPFSMGAGVQVSGVTATRDRLLERRLQLEKPSETREGAIADALGVVETMIGTSGSSIDKQMSNFFDAASRLSADPTAATARQDFLLAAQNLAGSFRDMASRLASAQQAADARVRGNVDEINGLTAQIARMNNQLGQVDPNGPQALTLKDQEKVALDRLTALIDVTAIERADGGVDLTVGNGHPLVIGSDSIALSAPQTGIAGFVDVTTNGNSILTEVTGGEIAGNIQVRDQFVKDYQTRLEALATQFVTSSNAVHTAGVDREGHAGGALFTTVPASGIAASMDVSTAIAGTATTAANLNKIAAGSIVGAPGDNQAARDMANLRDALTMDSGRATFSDSWGQLAYKVGNDTQAAKEEQASRQAIVNQVQSLSDAVSGVSIDEESMTMLKYQRAYEANAQFFRAIDSTLTTLFSIVN
ncbi:MAG: flagellar hook-associated protein FlgK [Acidobacteriota bacterium]